jgi:Immunity protein 26
MSKYWQQGMILEVPLEKEFGYTYVKLILTEELGYSATVLVKPYNILKDIPLKVNDTRFLENIGQLSYFLILSNRPKQRGDGAWKVIGTLPLTLDELNIPQFKSSSRAMFQSDWPTLNWYLIKDLVPNALYPVKYEDCKHLGIWQHSVDSLIRTKLTFFWIKRLGLSYDDYYSVEDYKKDPWLSNIKIESEEIILF